MSTWLLLRGLTRDARHWGDFPDALRTYFPADRVEMIDFAGNGRRHAEASMTSVQDMVADCRHQLRIAGQEEPVCLLAMSLGAMVAVEWASRFPDEIEGAVLVNTSLGGHHPLHWRLRPRSIRQLLQLILSRATDREWEAKIAQLTTSKTRDIDALIGQWVAYRQQWSVSRRNALRQLRAAAFHRSPTLRPLSPLLILASSRDRLVDVRCSRAIAGRWQLPIFENPDAGHDLPVDDAAWVLQCLTHWRSS